MINERKIYRAKGIYHGTNRESYITTVWRRTKDEAQNDIDMYGKQKINGTPRYTNTKIIEKDWVNFVNNRTKLKHPLPRY